MIGDGASLLPAVSLGLGLSKDLRKWAIRPEIGYDQFFAFGVGFNYYFRRRKE